MPPGKGPIWEFFFPGVKQNSSHHQAHCLGCIRHFRQGLGAQDPPNETDANLKARLLWDEHIFVQARATAGHVLGEKNAMIAHLIGHAPCPHASARATKIAKEIKKGKKPAAESDSESAEDEEEVRPSKKRKQVFRNVEKAMRQPELKLGGSRAGARAGSAGNSLPISLFDGRRMWRDVVSGTLLDAASAEVEKKLREALCRKYAMLSTDGWKDDSRNPITGVNVTSGGKSNGHKKDGASMCIAFEEMIDKTEGRYGCVIVMFCCDNDGGSQRGRKDLVQKRPWLLVVPCCAHQGQLMLGDYFAINDIASDVAEQATEAIQWISGHDRVKKIFDDAQFAKNFTILVYLMANITRWNTHYIAFQRLISLKIPIRHAIYLQREEIVRAQVGAEKNKKAIAKITAAVNKQCDVLESNEFWTSLQTVVDDIEPICYATNINQADATHLDQVLLTLAGVYRHFSNRPNRVVAKGMTTRIEKRWAALDQPLFVLCLVLNTYKCLEHFGDKSAINIFTLNTELIAKIAAEEQEVSLAFMHYLQGTRDFVSWRENRDKFQEQHVHVSTAGQSSPLTPTQPDDPKLMWEQMKTFPSTSQLANFALLLLDLVANQASNERSFSDLKIKKTRLRNRLGTKKLEKMSKFGADIRSENIAAGLVHERTAREVHDPTKVSGLLSVPRYADALEADEDEGEGPRPSKLIRSAAAWRVEVNKWVRSAQESEEAVSEEEEDGAAPTRGRSRTANFFPRSLALLFGGHLKKPVEKPPAKQFTREVLLMELLAPEESDEAPDDGALSGSGDEHEDS
ncbi:ribonuclease H-like domain-containing protein [Mycena leptocephala]|nr:ribonuclease H-like domain-containing protein [Mycena leptocephala]